MNWENLNNKNRNELSEPSLIQKIKNGFSYLAQTIFGGEAKDQLKITIDKSCH